MAVEGRTHRPVVDYEKCDVCGVCLFACPAETAPEMRIEENSLRGTVYQKMDTEINRDEQPLPNAPPCQLSCPINQDVRGYMKLIAEKRHKEALELIRRTNPLPLVCGYICHHPCEAACTRGVVDDALSIKSLKRFAAEYYRDNPEPPKKASAKGKKVVIIGSGPAGLTAAFELAQNGYDIEIIESFYEPGGMLAWAIPSFRLPVEVLRRDIDFIKNMGVVIKTNTLFGKDITLSDLQAADCRAVVIATGTPRSLRMNIENEEGIEGSLDCLSFLKKYSTGEQISIGKKVLVIGGGNAAVDSARSVLRLGAEKATILYRRELEQMPADRAEVQEAISEGVNIEFLTAPAKIIQRDGSVNGLQCVKTELKDIDDSGRSKPVSIEGSEFIINADTVISAVGQDTEFSWMADGLSLDVTSEKTLAANGETMQTSMEGVFAAGDVVNGPTTVVEAMASGKQVARAVDQFLSRKR